MDFHLPPNPDGGLSLSKTVEHPCVKVQSSQCPPTRILAFTDPSAAPREPQRDLTLTGILNGRLLDTSAFAQHACDVALAAPLRRWLAELALECPRECLR
jgi:hypothetical protein